ncbi:DUF448 domain-containing protein [Novosphingobium sp.]|uniref:DUF448 domain-containing protein n=1 Tax=Novosphingobium sp. TaxID=1874826 RepID=UPI00286C1BC6|nr:DUF448 domain-containing protein [Novosphingobium sp.]
MRIPHNEPLDSGTSGRADRPGNHGSAAADPERKCILTGDHGSRDDLLRLAISPEGLVMPDALARAPGRGAWIGTSRADLEIALAKGKLKGALARAFKGAALTIPDDLPARAEVALRKAFTERLGLEMKSGRLLVGSDRIAENARGGMVKWLAHASDASQDGSRKLDQAWRVGEDEEGSGRRGFTLPLDRAALSVALGRDNVVHLALTDRAAASRLDVPLRRLLRFLGQGEASDPGTVEGAAPAAAPSDAT